MKTIKMDSSIYSAAALVLSSIYFTWMYFWTWGINCNSLPVDIVMIALPFAVVYQIYSELHKWNIQRNKHGQYLLDQLDVDVMENFQQRPVPKWWQDIHLVCNVVLAAVIPVSAWLLSHYLLP